MRILAGVGPGGTDHPAGHGRRMRAGPIPGWPDVPRPESYQWNV